MSDYDDSTQITQLPPPPVFTEVDLRRFPNLPLDVQDLRDSDFTVLSSPAEFKAGILLMCAAWHQVPAGSLPVDDRLLAALVRLDLKTWTKVKGGALCGFTEHSDGRLYNPFLTKIVHKSWQSMQMQKHRTAARRERYGQRNDDRNEHQMKGKERNINKPPPQRGVSGGGFSDQKIGLGEMLTGISGLNDPVLLASLTMAADGASDEQLERAVAVIKGAGPEVNNLTNWALSIASKAAAGLVTGPPEPAAATDRPERNWEGKEGWRMDTDDYGELTVELGGMLRSAAGILHPADARAVAERLRSGEITLQP